MIKADIYLDVDGVLFCRNGKILELRDGFIGFLKFLTDNFENCYWLTCWYDGFNEILEKAYAGGIARKFKACEWNGNKALAIDFSRDFVWIEDGISDEELQVLIQHNAVGSYIEVPFEGKMSELYKIKKELKRRFNIEGQTDRRAN
jgi:hypothetical protein